MTTRLQSTVQHIFAHAAIIPRDHTATNNTSTEWFPDRRATGSHVSGWNTQLHGVNDMAMQLHTWQKAVNDTAVLCHAA